MGCAETQIRRLLEVISIAKVTIPLVAFRKYGSIQSASHSYLLSLKSLLSTQPPHWQPAKLAASLKYPTYRQLANWVETAGGVLYS